jgi:hypothetical protein
MDEGQSLSAIRVVGLATAIVLVAVAIYYVALWALRRLERFTVEQTEPVTSKVDGMPYRVHGRHSAPQEAADALARLNGQIIDLMRHLRARYVRGSDGVAYPERREAALRLLERYNPDNLAENSPRDPTGDTSYCLDKGAVVAICLRERGSTEQLIHDQGTLTFVTLHEMAHIAVDVKDHPTEFWAAFKFLLEEAEEMGLYRSPDYVKKPVTYCGVLVNYNPRLDPNLPSL